MGNSDDNSAGSNGTPHLGGITTKSRKAQVLDRLRDAILDGELSPGQPLIETSLAAELGVSRAPLREALQTLQAEGLIEIRPYKGTTVRRLTRGDIEELYSLRTVLETFAIQRIIEQGDNPTGMAQLRAVYDQMAKAAADGDFTGVNDADLSFHETMIRVSGHKLLLQIWKGVALRVRQLLAMRNKQNRVIEQIVWNHIPLLEAIEHRDMEQAAKLIKIHIASAADLAIDQYQVEEEESDT